MIRTIEDMGGAVMGDMEIAVMEVVDMVVAMEAAVTAAAMEAAMVAAMEVATEVVMDLLMGVDMDVIVVMEVMDLMEEEDLMGIMVAMEVLLVAMGDMGGIVSLLTNQYADIHSYITCNILWIHSLAFQDYWMLTMMPCMAPLHQ